MPIRSYDSTEAQYVPIGAFIPLKIGSKPFLWIFSRGIYADYKLLSRHTTNDGTLELDLERRHTGATKTITVHHKRWTRYYVLVDY